MASHKKMQSSPAPQATPEEIMKIYSGVGKTFRVKFVGSENIREKGDAVALACLKSLKTAQQQLGYHKPKAILGLNTKGLTLFDERSKANTRVAISKVSHLTHDPNDICYFGVVVMTTESTSGLKLYAFKAERQVAMQFNQSSKELFDLMFRLKEAKKRLRERREQEAAAAAAATEAAATTPAPKVVGGVEAPPDYHAALTFDIHRDEEENPPPVPPRKSITEPEPLIVQDDTAPSQQQLSTAPLNTEERRQRALDEWSKLESELDDIAKDLNLDTSGAQAPSELYSVPDKSKKLNSSGGFSDELLSLDLPSPTAWTNFDTTEAQMSSPFTSTPASSNPQESISLQLNPFAAQARTPSTFNSGMSAEYNNSAYNTSTSLEPNISMDLENILASPPQIQYPQQPSQPMASFGQQPFGTQPVVSGMGQPMGYPQGSFQPQQPVGMFQQPQQQAAPDLLSTPAGSESFMAFSQPLQPASSIPAPPPGPPPKGDVFADLLDIAKKNAPELASSTPPPPVKNEPKEYVSMNKMASVKDRPLPPVPGNDPFGFGAQPPPPPAVTTSPSTGFNATFGGVEEIYDDFDFSSNKPQQQQQSATPAAAAAGGGFGDSFGDSFGGLAPSSNPPAAAETGWIGFDDETKGQWL